MKVTMGLRPSRSVTPRNRHDFRKGASAAGEKAARLETCVTASSHHANSVSSDAALEVISARGGVQRFPGNQPLGTSCAAKSCDPHWVYFQDGIEPLWK